MERARITSYSILLKSALLCWQPLPPPLCKADLRGLKAILTQPDICSFALVKCNTGQMLLSDPDGTQIHNLQLRRLTIYPLGH